MVVIRMARAGTNNKPFYHLVAAEKRGSRDGKYLERLGTYDPKAKDVNARIKFNLDAINVWIKKGAQPSETVGQLIARASSKAKN